MPNPLVSQGTLNRLRGSFLLPDIPGLNVTAPYLGKEGMRLSLEGDATKFFDSLTGMVTSPEPYLPINLRLNLLRTQPLANAYKDQMELDALVGDCTVRTDSNVLGLYEMVNCSIMNVSELQINGEDAGYAVAIKGTYYINSALWNAP